MNQRVPPEVLDRAELLAERTGRPVTVFVTADGDYVYAVDDLVSPEWDEGHGLTPVAFVPVP